MADAQANINVNINTSQALGSIRALQAEISNFQQRMAKLNAGTAAQAASMQKNLISSINATGQFSARMATIASTTESFTNALEKNKFSLGEYFRYAGAASKNFSRLFTNELDTVNKVARERVKTLQTQYIKLGRDANGALQSIAVRPLTLDLQNLTTQTMMAAQKQQLFNQLIKQGSTNLLNWGKNTQWAGRQLMVGFTVPLTIFGSAAAKSFMELEEQAIRFKRVYGELFTTPTQADEMFNQLQRLGSEFTKYGVALADTMAMAADAAAMGKTGADLLGQVEQASRLAVLGQVEQQQALETTISLTNTFGTATEDLTSKINFLNAVENQTVTSIEDLTIAIPKAGPVIQQLGGDVEDLAFFLTAMKEGGINASEGANALKSGLASLINPTEKASEFLANLGINIKAIVEANAGDVKGTVIAFAQALDTLDPLNRARAIEQLFGKFQFSRLSTLFQNVIAEGNQASRVLDLTAASTEELAVLAERELKRVESSPLFKFRKAWEDLQAALAPVGEQFLKALTPVIEFGTQLLNKFNELSDGGKQFVTILVAGLGVIAPAMLMLVGLIGNGVANLIKFFSWISQIGKGGSGVQQLGMQTEYMTQAQLEANAVASALNQTHTNLRQTFSAEAASVAALTAAYEKAIAAQARLAITPGVTVGKGGAVRKFATGGIINGPGTGTSDSILAMVSNGEAIIPAKIVKENPGIIDQLISGNIPGFAKGSRSVSGAESRIGKSNFTVMRNYAANVANQGGLVDFLNIGGRADIASAYAPQIMKEAGVSLTGINKQITQWSQDNKKLIDQSTAAFKKGVSAQEAFAPVINKFNNDMKTIGGPLGKFRDTAKAVFPALSQDLKQAQEYARANKLNLRTAAGVEKLRAALPQNIAAQALATPGSYQPLAKTRGAVSSFFGGGRSAGKYGIPSFMLPPDLWSSNQYKGSELRGISSAQEHLAPTKMQEENRRSVKNITEESDAREKSTREIKKQTGAIRQQRVESQRSSSIASRIQTTTGKNGRTYYSVDGKRISEEQAKRAFANQERARKAAETRRANRAAAQQDIATTTPGTAPRSRPRIGMGGIGMTAMTVGMVGSMLPGKAGEIGGMLSGPLMALGMLSMLPGPIALVVAGLGSIAAVAYMFDKALKEATQSGLELAKSMSMSSEKIIAISEFTGTVSATELRQQRQEQQLAGVPGELSDFGRAFLESDIGKSIMDSITKQLQEGRSTQEAGKNLGIQLAEAVAQGVLTVDQAKSIAAEVAKNLGDYTISFKAAAELVSIVGINGEDLAKDPLKITLEIQEKSMEDQAELFNQALSNIKPRIDFVGGSLMAAGTAAVAAGGAMAATGVAAIPGAVTAGVGAAMMGISLFDQNQIMAENKELSAAAIQLGVQALAQNQSLVDVIYQQYELKIQQASTEEEINRLIAERDAAIDTQNQKNAEMNTMLLQQAQQLQQIQGQGLGTNLFEEAISASVDALYKEGPMKVFADQAKKDLEGLQDTDFKIMLQYAFASGELSPMVISRIATAAANNETLQTNFELLIQQKGLAEANQAIQILTQMGATDDTMSFLVEFLVDDQQIGQLQQNLDAMVLLSNISQKYGIEIDINEDSIDKIEQARHALTVLDEAPDVITKEVLGNFASEDEDLMRLYQNWDEMTKGQSEVNKRVIIEYLGIQAGNMAIVNDYLANEGSVADRRRAIRGRPTPQLLNEAQDWAFGRAMEADTNQAAAAEETVAEDIGSSGAGGKASSFLDDIVKQLRNFKNIQQEVTNGWDASLDAIMRFAEGGISGFNGLANQMRRVGVSEPLLEKILGMDPDEFERRKKELFTFDLAGNITGLTQAAQAIQNALNTATIANFINEQQNITISVNNQIVALNRLTAAGASYEAAYRAVQNTALAAAIATAKSSREIQAAAEAAMKAQEMMNKFEEINEEEMRKQRISDAVRQMNKDFSDQANILNYINKNRSKLSEAQISAILSNKDLRSLVLEPNIDPGALRTALANAEKQAELELKIKKLTVEGKQEIFDQGIQSAMQAFNAKEQQIELEFNAKIKDDSKLVEDAERRIAEIDFQLDDYQAGLQEIDWAEEKINEAYDKRFEALDKIAGVNEQIARSQQKQLDLADALSRGDIAAAARAAQELQAQQREDAVTNQRRMLEQSQQAEIASLRSSGGLTREELQNRIRGLEQEIFNIEEQTLEPAQERIRLADLQKQDQIANLEVLGKTREEWESIANQVAIAEADGWRFAEAMQEALNVMDELIYGLLNKPAPPPPPAPAGGGGGGGGGRNESAAASAPSSTPRPPQQKESINSIPGPQIGSPAVNAVTPAAVRELKSVGVPIPSASQLQAQIQARAEAKATAAREAEARAAATKAAANSKNIRLRSTTARANGGLIKKMSMGGMVPDYMANGGLKLPNFMPLGSDTIPTMLTPGEFVIRRPAVNKIGIDKLEKINRGSYSEGSVYNYTLQVNVKSESSPDKIARTVMTGIKQIESQKIRGNKI